MHNSSDAMFLLCTIVQLLYHVTNHGAALRFTWRALTKSDYHNVALNVMLAVDCNAVDILHDVLAI